MNIKITDATLLLKEGDGYKAQKQDLYISDGKILSVGKPCEGSFETFCAQGKLVMPGLINLHTHAYMSVFRNYADDVNFDEWLFKRIMPVEETLSDEAAYYCALFNCIEMIKTGTTCFMDMHMFPGSSARAANEIGLRAYVGRAVVGEDLYADGRQRFEQALKEQADYESELVKFVLSPHAIYSASPKMFEQVTNESEKRGLLRQTHLSESENEIVNCREKYNKTPAELLDDTGFLGQKAILAHCVRLTPSDIRLVKMRGASVVSNPASNAKLGNGFAPAADMKKEGVNLCLGTDSDASNNTQNMFREMGIFTLIHKGIAKNSTEMPANYVLDCALTHAAKAVGMQGKLGEIAPGAQADLAFLDLNSPSLFPANNIPSSLCYSANGSEVADVMVAGRFVMKNREIVGIDCQKVYAEVQRAVDKYL